MKAMLVVALLAVVGFTASGCASGHHRVSHALIFASYRDGLSAISTMRENGSGKRLVTEPQRSFAGQPASSPDGSKIAYVCGNFALCVMSAEGAGQRQLTTSHWPQIWGYVDHPTWSPDGAKIAFASNADGKFHVYVINADGTGLHKLAGTTGNDDDPAWSPDGKKIAFDNYRSWSSGTSTIYVMNADGTQPHQLSPPGLNALDPAWAPEGSKAVAFSAWKHDGYHLFVEAADGTGTQQVSSGSCDDTVPTWMSDRSLAFERNCEGRLGIAVGRFGSPTVAVVAPRSGFDANPEWQPAQSRPAATYGAPSTPTGDARVASTWFYWSTQVWDVDYGANDSAGTERRTLAHDYAALASLNTAHPDTHRGKLLRSTATAGFRLDAASSREFLLYYQATANGKHHLAVSYQRAGEKLALRAEKRFNAADEIAKLPY